MKKLVDKLSVILTKEPHAYGKLKFVDANDKVLNYVDCEDISKINTDFYKETVEYTELVDADNVYPEAVVAQIKFLNIIYTEKKYYWLINTSFSERSAGDVYIADTLEDAEAHRLDYCSWYCNPGDVTLRKVDQQFNEVERIDYFQGKVVEHVIYERDDKGRLLKAYSKIKNGKKVRQK